MFDGSQVRVRVDVQTFKAAQRMKLKMCRVHSIVPGTSWAAAIDPKSSVEKRIPSVVTNAMIITTAAIVIVVVNMVSDHRGVFLVR